MHEMVIVEGILKAILPEVEKHDVSKVTVVKLKIGEMAGLVPACIEEYFDVAAKGTIAEGARIEIENIPVAIRCEDCGYEGGVTPRHYRCPQCDSINFKLTAGREYFVDSVEAE